MFLICISNLHESHGYVCIVSILLLIVKISTTGLTEKLILVKNIFNQLINSNIFYLSCGERYLYMFSVSVSTLIVLSENPVRLKEITTLNVLSIVVMDLFFDKQSKYWILWTQHFLISPKWNVCSLQNMKYNLLNLNVL